MPAKWSTGQRQDEEPPIPTERYVAVPVEVFKTVKELFELVTYHPQSVPTLEAVLRIATIDQHGRIVLGIRVREL